MKRLFIIIAVLIMFLPAGVQAEMANSASNILSLMMEHESQSPEINPIYKFANEVQTWIEANQEVKGTIYYVDSGVSTSGAGTSWALAKTTLDAAIALCTANDGDIIYVAPGHAETISTITLDVAGITIIGLGSGTDRPTFTFNGATDEIIVDAANITVLNIRCVPTIADVANAFDLQDESDYFTIIGCEFPEPVTATHEFTTVFQLVTGADNVTIAYNTWINQAATPGANNFIDGGAAAIDSLSIIGNYINADAAVAALYFSDKADTNLRIENNIIIQEDVDQFCIELSTTATGIIKNNTYANLGGTAYFIDPGSCFQENNKGSTSIDSPATTWPPSINQISLLIHPLTNMDEPNGYGAADDPVIFTVTGSVAVKCVAIVITSVTSTSSDTIELGPTGDTAAVLGQWAADGSDGVQNDVWTLDQDPVTPSAESPSQWVIIPAGLDLKLWIHDHDLTAGAITFYLWWKPLAAGSTVVIATPS